MILNPTNKKHKRKQFTVKKYRWSNCNEQCEQEIFTNDKAINVLKGCQLTAVAQKRDRRFQKRFKKHLFPFFHMTIFFKQEKKNSIAFKGKKKSSDCLSLLGPQLHLRTLQGIIITSKCQPVDPIGKSDMWSTKILSVEIGFMTSFIPPSAFKRLCTRIAPKIVVLIFGGKPHSAMK